jgi:hypothetical protein
LSRAKMRRAANTEFVGYALMVTPMAPDERQGRLAFVDGDNLRPGNFLGLPRARSLPERAAGQ